MTAALLVYLGGALIGLLRSDGSFETRVTLAVLWPLGLAAFAITVTILLAASLVAFPAIGLIVGVLAAGAVAWALS